MEYLSRRSPHSATEDRSSDHSLPGSAEAIAPHLRATLQFTSPIRAPGRGVEVAVGLAAPGGWKSARSRTFTTNAPRGFTWPTRNSTLQSPPPTAGPTTWATNKFSKSSSPWTWSAPPKKRRPRRPKSRAVRVPSVRTKGSKILWSLTWTKRFCANVVPRGECLNLN